MASDEHLALLRGGAPGWNAWRAGRDATPDLSGASLRNGVCVPNTFEQTGAARSQIGLPRPPDVTAMLAISMICFGHHDGFPRKIVCRQIRGQFDCLVSSIRVQKIQACVDLPQFHKIQYTLQSC